MKTLAVFGAGGHGKVVADAAFCSGKWSSIIFFDDSKILRQENNDINIVGSFDELLSSHIKYDVIVAVGNNIIRLQKTKILISLGFNVVSVIHPRAIIAKSAYIDVGSVVLAGSIINVDAKIGKSVIINSNSVVEHDCVIGDGSHLSPMSSLAGGVIIGKCSWIGLNASVIQKIKIGSNVIVGAGASVIRDLTDGVTAVGVPAKVIKSSGVVC